MNFRSFALFGALLLPAAPLLSNNDAVVTDKVTVSRTTSYPTPYSSAPYYDSYTAQRTAENNNAYTVCRSLMGNLFGIVFLGAYNDFDISTAVTRTGAIPAVARCLPPVLLAGAAYAFGSALFNSNIKNADDSTSRAQSDFNWASKLWALGGLAVTGGVAYLTYLQPWMAQHPGVLSGLFSPVAKAA